MNSVKYFSTVVTFCFLVSPLKLRAITYDIPPRAGYLPSWSIDGGFITTDGTIGELSPQNFLNWELRFSSPSGVSTISSDAGSAFLHIWTFSNVSTRPPPSLEATENFVIANPGQGSLRLGFATQDIFADNFTGNAIAFVPAQGGVRLANGRGGGVGLIIDNTIDSSNPIGLFHSMVSPNQSTFELPSGPLVIGAAISVPEPSVSVLLMASASCIWLSRRVNRHSGLASNSG